MHCVVARRGVAATATAAAAAAAATTPAAIAAIAVAAVAARPRPCSWRWNSTALPAATAVAVATAPATPEAVVDAETPPPPPPRPAAPPLTSVVACFKAVPPGYEIGEASRAAAAPRGGQAVSLVAWVRSVRAQKKTSFMAVSDGSCATALQVVWPSSLLNASDAAALTTGACVAVEGTLVVSPNPAQPVEVAASRLTVVGSADAAAYPLQKKAHTPEFLRDMVHLRPRTPVTGAMLRMRHTLSRAVHDYFDADGAVLVNTPIITSNDCEGAGELFAVASAAAGASETPAEAAASSATSSAAAASAAAPAAASASAAAARAAGGFFGKPTYLTVSGQLHLEAFACALSRVYTFGPTFRAENSNTPRHLAEFWMVEPELAPCSMAQAMDNAEGCVKAAVGAALARRLDDIQLLGSRVTAADAGALVARLTTTASTKPFARMTYTDAVRVLTGSGQSFTAPVVWGEGLASEHERWLAEVFVGGPVFVTDYPAAIKPFYMRRNEEDGGKTVAAFDLLVPTIGELIGGSAREERYNILAPAMATAGLLSPGMADAVLRGDGGWGAPPADTNNGTLDWYLDLRRFGSVPHAGWGMGFERLVQYCTGIDNIRDAIPVPRVPLSCRM